MTAEHQTSAVGLMVIWNVEQYHQQTAGWGRTACCMLKQGANGTHTVSKSCDTVGIDPETGLI